MLGIRGWSETTGGTFVRRVWLEAGNGGEGPYGYSSANDWAWSIQVGDVVTDSSGLSDTIVSVVDAVSHVVGKLSYDAGHITAWDNGYATVTRALKSRQTVDIRGDARVATGIQATSVTASGGSVASLSLSESDGRWTPGAEWDTATVVLATPTTSGHVVTYVLDACVGAKVVINTGSDPFTVDQVAGSHIHRIATPGGVPFSVRPGNACEFVRDTLADHWRSQPVGDPVYAVPGLLKYHNAAVASSLTIGGGDVSQWDDLSGNGFNDTVRSGANAPSYAAGGVVFDSGNTEELIASGFNNNAQIGSKEFVFAIEWSGTSPRFGAGNGSPRLYLEEAAASYNGLSTLTYSSAGTVRVWGHDGTNAFHRQDGVEVDSAAEALSTLLSTWRTRPGIDGTLYRYAIYDASGWGSDYAANLAAVEAAFGVT